MQSTVTFEQAAAAAAFAILDAIAALILLLWEAYDCATTVTLQLQPASVWQFTVKELQAAIRATGRTIPRTHRTKHQLIELALA